MAKLWRFLSILIVAAVCLGLMLVLGAPPAKVALAAGNMTIGIQPETTTVLPGTLFDIEVWVQNPDANDIYGCQARLDFDSSYFNVTGIDNGPVMTEIALTAFDNSNGTVDHDASMPLPPGDPTNATSILVATIHCQAHAVEGASTIDFVYQTRPPFRQTLVALSMTDYLESGNMSLMHGGMVKVGGPPAISVSPNSLAFNVIEEGENPPDRTLELCNLGTGTLNWNATDNDGWLSESPMSGSLGEDGCEDVTVSVDVTGMKAGDYSATITITGSAAVEIPVSLHIESATVPIPGGPANLSASALSISPQQVQPGQEVTISINVANTGGETGSYNAVLYINEVVEDSQTMSVAAGASKNVTFTVTKSQAGVYDISLAGQSGQFEVVSGGFFGGGLSTGSIIVIVVAVIVLIVGLFLIRRGTRRET